MSFQFGINRKEYYKMLIPELTPPLHTSPSDSPLPPHWYLFCKQLMIWTSLTLWCTGQWESRESCFVRLERVNQFTGERKTHCDRRSQLWRNHRHEVGVWCCILRILSQCCFRHSYWITVVVNAVLPFYSCNSWAVSESQRPWNPARITDVTHTLLALCCNPSVCDLSVCPTISCLWFYGNGNATYRNW